MQNRKNTAKSGVSNNHINMNDTSEFIPVEEKSKNNTLGSEAECPPRREISRASSRQSSRSHKGLHITKPMNIKSLLGQAAAEPNICQKSTPFYIKKTLRELSSLLSDSSICSSRLSYLQICLVL